MVLAVTCYALWRQPAVVSSDASLSHNAALQKHQTLVATTEGETPRYYAFIGHVALFRGYLNDEFNQIIAYVARDAHWKSLALEDNNDRVKARRGARSRGAPTWARIQHQAVEQYGSMPAALLFFLKFHWNYAAMAQLGAAGMGHKNRMHM